MKKLIILVALLSSQKFKRQVFFKIFCRCEKKFIMRGNAREKYCEILKVHKLVGNELK